jgi:cobalt-zinc-cadmium efflux system outer membrane protein
MVHWLLGVAIVAAAQDTASLSLDAAVMRAVAASPAVAAAEVAIRAPRGERAEAWLPFRDNPTLSYSSVRRRSPGATFRDRAWVLSQEIELPGQNFVRASAAGNRVRGAETRVDDEHRLVSLEARLSYVRLATAEQRAALIDSTAVFAERLSGFARTQFEAGEVTRMEYNAAVLEAARQRSAADRALADLAGRQADLARVLALGSDSVPRTSELPAIVDLGPLDDQRILEIARSRRPDLAAAGLEAAAAAQDVTVTRLDLIPTLMLEGFTGREEDTDDLLGLSIGLRIPLFHRQQAARGAAAAERARMEAELAATERGVQAEVRAAVENYRRSRESLQRFVGDVLTAAVDNVALTERAFAEGEVDIANVLLLRGIAAAAQLEYLDVLENAYGAWFELAAAVAAEPAELTALMTQEADR